MFFFVGRVCLQASPTCCDSFVGVIRNIISFARSVAAKKERK